MRKNRPGGRRRDLRGSRIEKNKTSVFGGAESRQRGSPCPRKFSAARRGGQGRRALRRWGAS
eukprot:9345162-Pyramimonas_sp.AAC.1